MLHSSKKPNVKHVLDSDDSSDDDDEEDLISPTLPPIPKASQRITSKLSQTSGSHASAAAAASSFSKDLSDLPTDDLDIDVDSFSKALEALMSSKPANRSSSGFATDDDEFDQSEDSDDDDNDDDDDFLGDDDYDDDDDEGIETIRNYMREMDRQLAKTEMGKSFERVGSQQRGCESPKATANAGKASKAEAHTSSPGDDGDDDDDDDDDAPLDIDMTLVKNLLESYSTQPGFAGPATNILSSMGIRLPDPEGHSSQS